MKIAIRYNSRLMSDDGDFCTKFNPHQDKQCSKGVMRIYVDVCDAAEIGYGILNKGSWVSYVGITVDLDPYYDCNIEKDVIDEEISDGIKRAYEFWRDAKKDIWFIVINHNGYHFKPGMKEKEPYAFMGFGGLKMKAISLNGNEERISNDVWHRGEIPAFLWDKYPDTHIWG